MRPAFLRNAIHTARQTYRFLTIRQFRRQELAIWREFSKWRREHGNVLKTPLYPVSGVVGTVLVVAKNTINGCRIEIGLIKGLQLAGYRPVVLCNRTFFKYFRLAGVRDFVTWHEFTDRADRVWPEDEPARARSLGDVLALHHLGTRVGRFALSTTFRYLRAGHLDLSSPQVRDALIDHLERGRMHASASARLLDRVKPDIALFMDNRYTGQGELLDLCLARKVSVLTWFDGHRSNTLMLKRYSTGNKDEHHASLSAATWRLMQSVEWNDAGRAALRRELETNYENGDWYSRGGTQVGKQIVDREEIRAELGLDNGKPTAVIFPHIVWDATLFWGKDLFEGYEQWFIETVRAACANTDVNWIIKIHPAHVAKAAMERYNGEPAEMAAVREHIGTLPPHITVIPAHTRINTFSLFPVMDYCVTVRGTIGIESASRGIPVLTAGSGRYDHRGFTIDSETREEYLERLARIQEIPPLSPEQRELAERFAYGAYVLRPLNLKTFRIEYLRDIEATTQVSLKATSSADLANATDLRAFADWARDETLEDFINGELVSESEVPSRAHSESEETAVSMTA